MDNIHGTTYAGDQECCVYCSKKFKVGEIVLVDRKHDRVFCCVGRTRPEQLRCTDAWHEEHSEESFEVCCLIYHGNT